MYTYRTVAIQAILTGVGLCVDIFSTVFAGIIVFMASMLLAKES